MRALALSRNSIKTIIWRMVANDGLIRNLFVRDLINQK